LLSKANAWNVSTRFVFSALALGDTRKEMIAAITFSLCWECDAERSLKVARSWMSFASIDEDEDEEEEEEEEEAAIAHSWLLNEAVLSRSVYSERAWTRWNVRLSAHNWLLIEACFDLIDLLVRWQLTTKLFSLLWFFFFYPVCYTPLSPR
jgi:hypothetical protein